MFASRTLLIVVLLAWAPLCEGRRVTKRSKVAESIVGTECPGGAHVDIHSKGGCIDENSDPLPEACCAELKNCREEIAGLQETYGPRLDLYLSDCSVDESDIVEEDGAYNVADTTRICSEKCQGIAELAEPFSGTDLQTLGARCLDTRAAPELEALTTSVSLINVLDNAWLGCRECPGGAHVDIHSKGGCIDENSASLPEACCADLKECREDISGLQEAYGPRLDLYLSGCSIEESDIVEEDGAYKIADTARICSEKCQSITELGGPFLGADLQNLSAKCLDTRAAPQLEALTESVSLNNLLDAAWRACRVNEVETVTQDIHIEVDLLKDACLEGKQSNVKKIVISLRGRFQKLIDVSGKISYAIPQSLVARISLVLEQCKTHDTGTPMVDSLLRAIGKARVVLLIDESGSVGRSTFNNQMKPAAQQLIADIAAHADSTVKPSFGAVSYSMRVKRISSLSTDVGALSRKIQEHRYSGGTTQTGRGFREVHAVLGERESDAAHLVFHFTDGAASNMNEAVREKENLERGGSIVIGVGIGRGVNIRSLKKISSTGQAFKVNSYRDLAPLVNNAFSQVKDQLEKAGRITPTELLEAMIAFVESM